MRELAGHVRSDNGLGDRMGRTALRKRGPFQKLFLGNILCRDTCANRKQHLITPNFPIRIDCDHSLCRGRRHLPGCNSFARCPEKRRAASHPFSAGIHVETEKRPSVRVPVLSKATISASASVSKWLPPFTNMILEMVENASEKKASSEKFITRFARVYTPIVCLAAVIVIFSPGRTRMVWPVWTSLASTSLLWPFSSRLARSGRNPCRVTQHPDNKSWQDVSTSAAR